MKEGCLQKCDWDLKIGGCTAILSIALQLIDGATQGPPGGPGPVFPAGDLPGLADDDARNPGRLFPRPGIGG